MAPNNTGLVGYWAMEEGTGTQAGDSSGNGNTGTLTNSPTWTDGKRGKALSFDGVNDYVDLGNPATLKLTGAMTVSTWVRQDTLNESSRFVAKQGGGTDRGWTLNAENTNPDVYSFQIASNSTTIFGTDSAAADGPVAGEWSHLVGVYTPSVSMKLYKNGVEIASNTTSVPASQRDSTLNVNIGRRPDGVIFTDGLIDEVRIYNRALSGTEVASLYNSSGKITTINSSQNSRLTSGLVGLWSFNGPDVSGVAAYDRSGSGNNGTISGATPAIGKVGQALVFDGTDDNVNLGNPSVLNLNTNFTISAWVKVNNFGVTEILQGIVAKGDSVTPFDTIGIRADGSGSGNCPTGKCLTFRLNDGTNNAENSYDAVTGTWYHVVMVVGARGAGGLRGYIDGVERVTENTSTVGDVTTTNNWYVGYNQRNNYYFNGVIDEVRIYNRALSAGEIGQLYNMGR